MRMAPKDVVTGTVMSQFGAPAKSEFSPYASLPRELEHLVTQLAKVEYPITSKKELLEKLGGSAAQLYIGENVVEAEAAIMFFPAAIFPIASAANLAEKLSEEYARRAPFARTRQLTEYEIDDLTRRFVAENAELFPAVARAVQTLGNFDLTKGPDDDVLAGQFIKENKRLFSSLVTAFSNAGRLRGKSREDLRENPKKGQSAGN
jgi:hypothetical protein